LAEDYGDYRALTELCYQASRRKGKNSAGLTVKSFDQQDLAKRLDKYLATFKQEFAFELYQWWIRKGSWMYMIDRVI
jgi:Non-repetitive/WGA-negative nucleoporin C-terminal